MAILHQRMTAITELGFLALALGLRQFIGHSRDASRARNYLPLAESAIWRSAELPDSARLIRSAITWLPTSVK